MVISWLTSLAIAISLLAGLHYAIWWRVWLGLSADDDSADGTRVPRHSFKSGLSLLKTIVGIGFLVSFVWTASLTRDGNIRAPHLFTFAFLVFWSGICIVESFRDFRAFARANLTANDRSR